MTRLSNLECVAIGLHIMSKYKDGSIAAEHDEIWAGRDTDVYSKDDFEKLKELGWIDNRESGFRFFV